MCAVLRDLDYERTHLKWTFWYPWLIKGANVLLPFTQEEALYHDLHYLCMDCTRKLSRRQCRHFEPSDDADVADLGLYLHRKSPEAQRRGSSRLIARWRTRL